MGRRTFDSEVGSEKREQKMLFSERVLCLDALVSFIVLFYGGGMGERQQKRTPSLFLDYFDGDPYL